MCNFYDLLVKSGIFCVTSRIYDNASPSTVAVDTFVRRVHSLSTALQGDNTFGSIRPSVNSLTHMRVKESNTNLASLFFNRVVY